MCASRYVFSGFETITLCSNGPPLFFVQIATTSSSGTDTLELGEKEIFVVSTNNAERQLAITKYNEMVDSIQQQYRSKSKSPRRKRVDREDLPPSPLPPVSSQSADHITAPSSSSKSRSIARRPHTSAGPSDKPPSSGPRLETSSFGGRIRDDYPEDTSRGDVYKKRRSSRLEDAFGAPPRRDSNQGVKRSGKSYFFSSSAPKMGSAPSGGSTSTSTSTTTSSSSVSSSSHGESESDYMREWEAELAKIEQKSRRSSDLLGFAKFLKKRPSTTVSTPRVVLPGS